MKNPFERMRELHSPTIFAMAHSNDGIGECASRERTHKALDRGERGGDEREAEVIGDIVISINATYIKGK